MKKLLLVLFCALPFFALCQTNYKTGSITTNDGNTLTGFINYREWVENPKAIEFKINQSDAAARIYTASDLKGFMIGDMDNYVTYTGRISMNHTRFPDLSTGADSSTKQVTAFFRQLVKGQHLNLYSYTDAIKTRYFVQEQQGPIVELLYQNYYSNDGSQQIKTLKSYTGYLIYLAGKYHSNDAGLIKSIDRSGYNSDITNLIEKINGDDAVAHSNDRGLSGVRYYVGAAYNQNKFTFTIPGAGDVEFNKSVPALNLGLDVLSNKNVQSFFVRADLTVTYSSLSYNKSFDGFYIVNGIPYTSNNLSYFYTTNFVAETIAPQVAWDFYNTEPLKLYVDAGVGLTFIQYLDEKMERSTNTSPLTKVDSFDFGNTRLGFPVQIGAIFNKRYEVYASYQHHGSAKPTKPTEYNLKYNSIALGFHLLLGK